MRLDLLRFVTWLFVFVFGIAFWTAAMFVIGASLKMLHFVLR